MKNKIIAFLSLVIISVGCKKSENNIPTQDPVSLSLKLSTDSHFTSIVKNEMVLSNAIQNILVDKKMNADSLILLLSKLNSGDNNEAVIKKNLNNLGSPMLYEYLQNFSIEYKRNWINLTNTYNTIPTNVINEACSKYLQQQNLLSLNNGERISSNGMNITFGGQCGWGYSLCIAGATAGAVICHASCIGATAGFGAPVCLLLCGTIQVAAGAQCMKSYCN